MYTRSLIQQQIERENRAFQFQEGLEKIMEKYNIKDSVFCDAKTGIVEVVKGYFVEAGTYDNLEDAIKHSAGCVRIQDNHAFTVGAVYESLTKCPEGSKILDLDTLEYVA